MSIIKNVNINSQILLVNLDLCGVVSWKKFLLSNIQDLI